MRVERLLNEIRRAKVKAALLIFNAGISGDKYDWRFCQMRNFLQTHEQVKTIETWHFKVKGDEVEHLRLSQTQIDDYTDAARQKNLAWAKSA